jgi:hypothetical protein
VLNKQVRAAEYRRLALEAAALAAASPLDQVRAKHELAAETWRGLAAIDELPRDRAPARAAGPRIRLIPPKRPDIDEAGRCIV